MEQSLQDNGSANRQTQRLHCNRGMMFSTWSMPRCLKQDESVSQWVDQLVSGSLRAPRVVRGIKRRPWVPWDSEPRITASMTASSNLAVSQSVGTETERERARDTDSQQTQSSVEKKRQAVVRPLFFSKRRPCFKTRRSLWRAKIWSWISTGIEIEIYCADKEGQQQLTGLEWSQLSWV
jgi:hypothetical protein